MCNNNVNRIKNKMEALIRLATTTCLKLKER